MSKDSDVHPFEEPGQTLRSLDPCIVVIFGATGDLTARKLMPALYNLKEKANFPQVLLVVVSLEEKKPMKSFVMR